MKSLQVADQVLPDRVKNVRTFYPGFNRAIVLGGAPLGCVWNIHGPTGEGKTTFAVGLINSFTHQGHLGLFIDAEYAATKKWFRQLGTNPEYLMFQRPKTMEDCIDKVDETIEKFDIHKEKGNFDDQTGMIIVVDSINKLTPQSELKKFAEKGAEAIEKGLARFRGLYLQAWLDRMTPIIGDRDIALICIAQEREVKDANPWDPKFRVKGCQGLMFDSVVQMRLFLGKKEIKEVKKQKVLAGKEHRFIVFKNKVGYPLQEGKFYTSTGLADAPIGFNKEKEFLVEGIRLGIIEKSGKWYNFDNQQFDGEKKLEKALRKDKTLFKNLGRILNEKLEEIIQKESS